MSSVVTGEAVVLELKPAGFAARGLSVVIDILAQIVLAVLLLLLIGNLLDGVFDPAFTTALALVVVVLILLVLPVTVETLTRGKSLGRLVMGLRIVRDDGGAIRFRHAFIRGMLAILEIYLLVGSLAFLVSLFNERSKRLGDLLAGTYAMRERVVARPRAVLVMPPRLEAWAATADIGRLPDALARRMSQFLAQAPRLTPSARATLAVDLAAEASRHVRPVPPADTHPEEFLHAVVAARRDRDYAAMMRQRTRTESTARRLHTLPFGQGAEPAGRGGPDGPTAG
ncbi:RDD family protein [Arthrobacter sp. L77]|uniref:RDD family protein n=1 Tax=Arthrobacter sp. L77 TaxID=1496689 RepID=UPI000692567F|nr:RDD family protein [Arthrobacter sp. L77]